MEHFKQLEVLLAIQLKYAHFFEKDKSLITDFVEVYNGKLTFIKVKQPLPEEIIDDIMARLRT